MEIVGFLRTRLRSRWRGSRATRQILLNCQPCGQEVPWPEFARKADGSYYAGLIKTLNGRMTVDGQAVHDCPGWVPEQLGAGGIGDGPVDLVWRSDLEDAARPRPGAASAEFGEDGFFGHTCGGGVRLAQDLDRIGAATCPVEGGEWTAVVHGGEDHICIGGVIVHRCGDRSD